MKIGDDILLHGVVQIDHQIATANQIHAQERRVFNYIVAGEHTHIANPLVDPEATLLRLEVIEDNIFGQCLNHRLWVNPAARNLERQVINIGSVNAYG